MWWGLFGCNVKGGSLLLSQPVVSRRTRVLVASQWNPHLEAVSSDDGGVRPWAAYCLVSLLCFDSAVGFPAPLVFSMSRADTSSLGVSLPQNGGPCPLSFVPSVGRRVPCSDPSWFR